jgi:hypothetical protein
VYKQKVQFQATPVAHTYNLSCGYQEGFKVRLIRAVAVKHVGHSWFYMNQYFLCELWFFAVAYVIRNPSIMAHKEHS